MGVQLSRGPSPRSPSPPSGPNTGELRMIAACALRAQTLRSSADAASPLQSERAVVEYGAAAALERAAHMWADGSHGDARSWMAAAENSLVAALVPVPWNPGA
jgi:hypothetical protein